MNVNKEDIEFKINKLHDLVFKMSEEEFNKYYLNNLSFHRLIQFIDKDLYKVFEDLLKDSMYELKTEKVTNQQSKEFKMTERQLEEYDKLQYELFKLRKSKVQ